MKGVRSSLLKLDNKLEAEKHIDTKHPKQIVESIWTFADVYHHEKEENLLFSVPEETKIRGNWDALAIIASERYEVHRSLEPLYRAVHDYKNGEKNASQRILRQAINYISFLMLHIQKRRYGVFPRGRQCSFRRKAEEDYERV